VDQKRRVVTCLRISCVAIQNAARDSAVAVFYRRFAIAVTRGIAFAAWVAYAGPEPNADPPADSHAVADRLGSVTSRANDE
jgi:hypothetical protein